MPERCTQTLDWCPMSVTSPQHIQPALILLDSDDDEQARILD